MMRRTDALAAAGKEININRALSQTGTASIDWYAITNLW
jgi:hypothetical protein